MKRNLMLSSLIAVMLFALPSFTPVDTKPPAKKAAKRNAAPLQQDFPACGAVLNIHVTSFSAYSITIEWNPSSASSYGIGGYWNTTGPSLPPPSGTTYANSLTLAIPSSATGGRVAILAKCADGSTSTGADFSHGVLFDKNSLTWSTF
ncbi:hypothetical protein FPZ42_13455 [Mucilaginibacter achroorhodeus]|uniref:Fibronectin type-III domain-containing protein n=1 Tax=Mucilaginibacter achroorhodeus TaxID=2599294 RepID=A0A563U2M6_9SPHI|nr:hypothetical protein [Mucilaginibacter achroorhodeus]TWR25595.1 hypothetical protein FPZ42_13455 [Mucilaginibacter achroorhodeus]